MRIPGRLLDEIVAHARAEAPNECCGLVGYSDGTPATVYRARNKFESPMRFELDPADQIRIYNESSGRGEELGALYHSHPRTEAYPSQTDLNRAAELNVLWPGMIWLICSLAGPEPVVRGFRLDDGTIEELELSPDPVPR